MGEFILNIMESWGYIGITFLIALENVFPPIPSEVILTFGGFMTTNTSLSPLGVILSASIGSLIGAIILYYVGYILKDKLSDKLKIKKEDIAKSNAWFAKKGNKAVLLGRCIPIIRSLISIPAGINKMNLALFFFYTTIGTVIWNAILVYAGVMLGDNWSYFSDIISRYSKVVLVVIVLYIIFKIWIKKVRQKKLDMLR